MNRRDLLTRLTVIDRIRRRYEEALRCDYCGMDDCRCYDESEPGHSVPQDEDTDPARWPK